MSLMLRYSSSRYEQRRWRFKCTSRRIVHQIMPGRAYAYIFVTTHEPALLSQGLLHWHPITSTFLGYCRIGALAVGLKGGCRNLRDSLGEFSFHPSGEVELSSSGNTGDRLARRSCKALEVARRRRPAKVFQRSKWSSPAAASAVVYHGYPGPLRIASTQSDCQACTISSSYVSVALIVWITERKPLIATESLLFLVVSLLPRRSRIAGQLSNREPGGRLQDSGCPPPSIGSIALSLLLDRLEKRRSTPRRWPASTSDH